ncbi:MAG: RNA polymerase sigma factor [bacterium]|nr:RNA polymerase sigma factor [bacterium]
MNLPPFQNLVDEHARSLHRSLCGMVGLDAADDCLQETLLAALRAYPRLRHDRNLRGWLFTIAHRKGIDHLRRSSRETPSASVGDRPSPPEPVRDIELWNRVAALPPKQRTAVTLRYLGDLAYADVARIMAISEPAARQNVRAGLASLRKDYR